MNVSPDHRGRATNDRDHDPAPTSKSIEWYSEGQGRDVVVAGVRMTVRFVGRKGRRARIAITGPAGLCCGRWIRARRCGCRIVPLNGRFCECHNSGGFLRVSAERPGMQASERGRSKGR